MPEPVLAGAIRVGYLPRMRRWVPVAVALTVLAAAPAAHADVTIGNDLATAPTAAVAEAVTAVPAGMTVPSAGVITRWRVRTGSVTSAVRLRVLRAGFEVARSAEEPAPPVDRTTVFETQVAVAAGDQIALECCASGGMFFVPGAGETALYAPPIAEGGAIPATPSSEPDDATALNVDLEPDIDGDGAGDDTQDLDDDGDGVPDAADDCPTRPASTADGCPASPPPPPPPPPPAAPRVNQPPTVRFKTPLSGTAIGPSHTIELEVSDDAGIRSVGVFDDDGTICTLTAAPFTCTWEPTGADVGRATLLASAVDTDGRSTLGIVRVRVSRFEADLTLRRKGRRVRGRLVLPAAVERSLGCRGDVTVRRKKVRRTVALKRNCTYTARLPRGRGKPRARFAGNPVVEPAT